MDKLYTGKSIIDLGLFCKSVTNRIKLKDKTLDVPMFSRYVYNEGIDSVNCMLTKLMIGNCRKYGTVLDKLYPNTIMLDSNLSSEILELSSDFNRVVLIGKPGFDNSLTLRDNVEIGYSPWIVGDYIIAVVGCGPIGWLVEDTNHIGAAITSQKLKLYEYIPMFTADDLSKIVLMQN